MSEWPAKADTDKLIPRAAAAIIMLRFIIIISLKNVKKIMLQARAHREAKYFSLIPRLLIQRIR